MTNATTHSRRAEPKYPKPVWLACFAAQLFEEMPAISLGYASKVAEMLFGDLCGVEPEVAARSYAQFVSACANDGCGRPSTPERA